jgi:uncharacterized membrane protein YdjX (TVP38/TMEM64 family)
MNDLLRRLSSFLARMDAKAWTSVLLSEALLLFVLFMLIWGQHFLNLDRDGQLDRILAVIASSRWAVLGVVLIFSFLALTGFPQAFLIMATVLVFGPVEGAANAWLATMISATITFWIGRRLGGGWVQRVGGERVNSLVRLIARHGALSSAIIRIVPSAPFIVVNSAAGAARISIFKYWIGTGVGIIPKIMFIAVLAAMAPNALKSGEASVSIFGLLKSIDPLQWGLILLVIAFWIGFIYVMRRLYRDLRRRENANESLTSINDDLQPSPDEKNPAS